MERHLFKRVQLEPGAIPNKNRELIGVAIAAISKCRYCAYYHTELAKLNGASAAEIEDAVHFAKSSAGWSTCINGRQLNYDEFKAEVDTRSAPACAAAVRHKARALHTKNREADNRICRCGGQAVIMIFFAIIAFYRQ